MMPKTYRAGWGIVNEMTGASSLPTKPSLLVAPGVALIHRDLSWLQFNERVLAEAFDRSNPPLERLKFLSITSSNLDEFFMIRFSPLNKSVQAQARQGQTSESDRLAEIRASLLEAVVEFSKRQNEALQFLSKEFAETGIHVVRDAKEGSAAFQKGREVFEKDIMPRLEQMEVFDAGKLSLLENLQTGILFQGDAWMRVPRSLPLTYAAEDEGAGKVYGFFLDDLLATHLGQLFKLSGAPCLFRMTRDGDFTVDLDEQDTESIPELVRKSLGSREKGRPVRLQFHGKPEQGLLDGCATALKIQRDQLLPAPGGLLLNGLWSLASQISQMTPDRPGLRYPAPTSIIPKSFAHPPEAHDSYFDEIAKRDYIFHHPYDSFDAFVNWVRAACTDPKVTMIEQTVYRMDALSPMIEALKAAARHKKVRVLIELRARFDEANNLRLADDLRKGGVEVAFGFGKLKLHAKIALVTRQEGGAEKLYTHLSTGNYNATTARQYTDMGILTSHPEIGADGRHFFDSLWNGEVPSNFKQLVSAPAKLHRRLLSLIDAETKAALSGKPARIVAKANALVDKAVIENLYRASNAGVQVDLIVRGACSLVPGVKGLSENIRVISVVDRFLEHSRIYYFESAKAIYLSSADWMPRNFFSRIELAFPVLDPYIYDYLSGTVIPAYLRDAAKARELTPEGTWRKRSAGSRTGHRRAQEFFEELAKNGYKGTPLE